MSSQPYNPVLLYKTQGTEQADEVDNIAKDDIILCIQFKQNFRRILQWNLVKTEKIMKFSEKIVCLDSTHGTTMYDFLLITVMALDEHDEGVPIAWALSNREDLSVLVEFFKAKVAI